MDDDRQKFAVYLVRRRNCAPGTAFTYEQGLRRIERVVGKRAEDITPDDLEHVYLLADYHPATKNHDLVAIRQYHLFRATILKRCKLNGIMQVRGPKVTRTFRPPITVDQARVLLDACKSSRQHRIIRLGLYAGCRVSDAATIGAVNWIHEGRTCKLVFTGQKERRVREIPMHPELARYAEDILAVSVTDGTLKHVCRSLAHYTGIDFTPHTLRRTFARTLMDAGVQDAVIEDLMGHAPSSVLRRHYTGISWAEKVAAIAKLSY